MSTVTAFRKIQRGKESVRGTALAATARWIGELTLEEGDKKYKPLWPYGVLTDQYGPSFVTAKFAELAYSSDLTFEEIIDFLIASLKGGVSGVVGATTAYTWTFSHDPTADPAPDTFTVELGNSDGSTDYGREMEYAFVKDFEVSAGIDEEMKFKAGLAARQVTDTTITAAIGVPSTREVAVSQKLKVYIDDTWAGLGTTQITGEILDMTLSVKTGLREGKFLSGDLYFDAYRFGPIGFDLNMTVEFASTADSEQEKRRSSDLRFVRLVVEGTEAEPGVNKKIQFDLACEHSEDSLKSMFGEREGNDTITMHLHSRYDPTAAKDIEVVVINTLSAIA